MTNTDRYLLHKKATVYAEMLLETEAKIKVCTKMLAHSENKELYQNEGDEAADRMCWLEVQYKKVMAELNNTAKPLNRDETKAFVSEMTNMGIAEQMVKQN